MSLLQAAIDCQRLFFNGIQLVPSTVDSHQPRNLLRSARHVIGEHGHGHAIIHQHFVVEHESRNLAIVLDVPMPVHVAD